VLLAVDTSTTRAGIALYDGEVLAESVWQAGRDHGRHLMPAIQETMRRLGRAPSDLTAVAAARGPGSFTGLRVGLATARAIAQALGRPVTPVGTLSALAAGIAEAGGEGRSRLAVLDGRRGEAFAALLGAGGEEVWGPFVAKPADLAARVRTLPDSALASGSGALRFRGELEAAGAEVLPDASEAHRLWARHVCRLAVDGPSAPPEAIQPIYLRPPDAQVWLDRDSP